MCGRYVLSDQAVLDNYWAELTLKYGGDLLKTLKNAISNNPNIKPNNL